MPAGPRGIPGIRPRRGGIATSLIIVAAGAWLPVSPLAHTLGLVPLPPRNWLFLAVMLLGYAVLTQAVKSWFTRRFGD